MRRASRPTRLAASTAEASSFGVNALPGSSFGLSVDSLTLGAGSNSGPVTGSLLTELEFTGGNLTFGPGFGAFSRFDFTIRGILLGQLEVKNVAFTVSRWGGIVVAGPV